VEPPLIELAPAVQSVNFRIQCGRRARRGAAWRAGV